MPIILPYEEKIIQNGFIVPEGAFVFPNGKFELASTLIEYARDHVNCCLTEDEKILWEKWFDEYGINYHSPIDSYCEFLLRVCNIDIISAWHNLIVLTTDPCKHIKYFNYYLMDFILDYQYSKKIDENGKGFFAYDKDCSMDLYKLDEQYKKEADDLKSKVLLRDRPKYFRNTF